jgi:hypothetical protein
MTICNRKIFNIEVTRDSLDRFFDIGLHSSKETLLLFNIGFFGCVVWVSFFDTVVDG